MSANLETVRDAFWWLVERC